MRDAWVIPLLTAARTCSSSVGVWLWAETAVSSGKHAKCGGYGTRACDRTRRSEAREEGLVQSREGGRGGGRQALGKGGLQEQDVRVHLRRTAPLPVSHTRALTV
jgi:hypothetical protein